MDGTICYLSIVVFLISVVVLVILVSKKYKLATFPNRNLTYFQQNALGLLGNKGYKVVDKKKGFHIEKGPFTAAGIIFEQNGSDVVVYRYSSSTNITLILEIIGFIILGILTIIVGIISEYNSINFAKKEIKPLLEGKKSGSICVSCGKPIPKDGRVCPYCGTMLRYQY